MPRLSRRKRAIEKASSSFRSILRVCIVDSDEESSLEEAAVVSYGRLQRLHRTRYFDRGDTYRSHQRAQHRFEDDLDDAVDLADQIPWLNDDEFLRKYRMTRMAFNDLLNEIKDDPVFHNTDVDKRGRQQRPVSYQLMTTLKALGSEGTASSNPNLRDVFSMGRGTSLFYVRRVVQALRNLKEEYVKWPNREERKVIARRIEDKCGLPNCVGIIDGTLFPLAFRPQTVDAPDYKGRKHLYSISSVIICDDQRFIRYYVAGWPGSTHDNRIARNTKMWQTPDQFMQKNEYIMGDSAFENLWFMVSAYTATPGQPIEDDYAAFNKCLSRARVVSEHTIGLLKGRFPWLRSIRKVIKDDECTLAEILSFMDACVILHNFLLHRGLSNIENSWQDDRDDLTDVDDVDRLPPGDELNRAVPDGSPGDFRRTQLLYYLQERGDI